MGKPLQLPGAAWNMIQPSGKSSFTNVAELPAANHHNLIPTDIYNVRFFLSLCIFSVKQRFEVSMFAAGGIIPTPAAKSR